MSLHYDTFGATDFNKQPLQQKRRSALVPLAAVALLGCCFVVAIIANQKFSAPSASTELLTYAEKNQGFPQWAHPIEPDVLDRSIVNSRWAKTSSYPPYVSHWTLYSGEGVDREVSGNNVRLLLKMKTQFRYHHWNSNNFVKDFESPQLRFLSRDRNSYLIVPPLSSMPFLSHKAVSYLNRFLLKGGNTLVICGSPSNVLFMNENLPGGDLSGFDLESVQSDGPFEQQRTAIGTEFQGAATTMPGPAWGVDPKTLPANAVSIYEAPGASVVFMIPAGTGSIIFVGFDFEKENPAWDQVFQLATGMVPPK